MKKAEKTYEIWAKGSKKHDGSVGAAWKIVHGDDKRTGAIVPKIQKEDKSRGAEIAELVAVKQALQQVPLKAEVHLHIGADNIIDMLAMGRPPRKDAPDGLKTAFREAMAAIDQLSSFRVSRAGGRRNDHMNEVIELAKAQSGTSSRETARILRRSQNPSRDNV